MSVRTLPGVFIDLRTDRSSEVSVDGGAAMGGGGVIFKRCG
jgi:hypothetical protein